MKKILPIILLFMLSCDNSDSNDQKADSGMFVLREWEVNIGSGWQKTGPVPWETEKEQGGIGAKDHDGMGEYRANFQIPGGLENSVPAFFTECLDDADRAYLNGNFIGETGKVPRVSNNFTFRSGTREPRFYILPEKFINKGSRNELLLKVYDFAGKGGFCFKQEPVIGPYPKLLAMADNYRAINNIPRIIMLLFLARAGVHFLSGTVIILKKKKVPVKKMISKMAQALAAGPKSGKAGKKYIFDLNTEISFRYILLFLTYFLSAIFLLSEVSFKYHLVQSERVWFKLPAAAISLAYLLIILFYHKDVFGELERKKGAGYYFLLILSILTSPVIFLFPVLKVIFSRPEDAWSFLVTGFFGIMALISSLLFLATAINLLYASLKAGKDKNQKIYFKEGATRLGLFTAQISATAIFLSYSRLSGNGFLIASIFMPFFLITSVQFIKKTGIRLPVSVKVGDLGEILRNKFRLTNTEIQICRLLNSGFGKDQVLTELGINHIALKFHLNNIYSKTLDQDTHFFSQRNFKKLPGLLIFLRDISKK